LTYVDYLDKLGQVGFILPQMTVLNHDNIVNNALSALGNAVDALTRGNRVTSSLLHSAIKQARITPADNDARRSSAVQYHYTYLDGNGDVTPGYVTVPIADWDAFSFPPGQDTVQRAAFNAAEEALADAMEQYTHSPDGTTVTVTKIVAVGRA
jgi:hypothetical protein